MTMYVPSEHYTEGSLRIHHGDGAWVSRQGNSEPELNTYPGICVNTLDHYVETHNIGEIALIKCDVEGAELLVFKGGAKCLRRIVPMLLLECYEPWTEDFGYKARDLFAFLNNWPAIVSGTWAKNSCKKSSLMMIDFQGAFPNI